MAPRSVPVDQPGARGLERRDVEVYTARRIPGRFDMKRFAVTSAVLLGFLAVTPGAFAQAAKVTAATPSAAPPPAVAKARMMTPVKGTAYVEVIQGQREQIAGDTQRVRAPIAAGEVVEITTRSPVKPGLYKSTLMFVHANGKVTAKGVKKFTDDAAAKK